MEKVSFVIGVYNSEKTIESVIGEIMQVFEKNNEYKIEIVLVDDYSPDGVYKVIKSLAQKDKRIKVLHLAKNSGQHNAVMEGYRHATGDYIISMDDDFQMPAEEALNMLTTLKKNDYDVVFAKYREQKESLFRRLGSRFNNKMTEVMIGKPRDIRVNSFFVMRKFVKDGMLKYKNNYPYIYGIIFSITTNVANLLVEHRERTNGKSNYTFRKLVGLWMNGFLNFSVEPLRIAIKTGVMISFISFIFAVILIIQRLLFTIAIGWTSLMVAIIFFAGVQLIGIGVLGEYLGRMYISDSGLPRTTIKEKINCEDED